MLQRTDILKWHCDRIIVRMVTSTFVISFLNLCYPRIFSSVLVSAQEPHIRPFLANFSYVYTALYNLPSSFLAIILFYLHESPLGKTQLISILQMS